MKKAPDPEKATIEKLKAVDTKKPEQEKANETKQETKKEMSLHDFEYTPDEEVLYAWEALEKEKHNRDHLWYIGVFVFLGIAILYALWERSWLMAITFILLVAVMILYANHPPRKIEVFLTKTGFFIDKTKRDYEKYKSFWIVDDYDIKRLYFRSKSLLKPPYEIFLHNADKEIVRNILSHHLLEEKNKRESFLARCTRALKL